MNITFKWQRARDPHGCDVALKASVLSIDSSVSEPELMKIISETSNR